MCTLAICGAYMLNVGPYDSSTGNFRRPAKRKAMNPMNPTEQEELHRLCIAVIHEPDPYKLSGLVAELNEFLECREREKHSGVPQPAATKGTEEKAGVIDSVVTKAA